MIKSGERGTHELGLYNPRICLQNVSENCHYRTHFFQDSTNTGTKLAFSQAADHVQLSSPWPRESWRASCAAQLGGPQSPSRIRPLQQVWRSVIKLRDAVTCFSHPLSTAPGGVPKQHDDMAALSAQESKKAAVIARYVEQIPAAAVTEMLERVLNYTGDEQRKVSHTVRL